MLVNNLFIYSIVCWSPKITRIIILASGVSLTSFSLLAFSIFLISGLRNSEAYNAFSHLFHEQCRLLVTKGGHNDYLSVESFSLTSLSEFASSKFVIFSLRIFEEYSACYHFIHRQCCLLVNKMITLIILASEVSLTSFSLFASSIFLISELRSSAA